MKKIFTFLFAGAAIAALSTAFTACNEPNRQEQNEEGTEIQPVPVNEMNAEVVDFFDKNAYIFNLIESNLPLDYCLTFNSMDELPKVDRNGLPVEYPVIDFDSYTIIFGEFFTTSIAGWVVTSQSVIVGADKMTVYITAEDFGGFDMPASAHFWGLYPKLPNLPIDVVRE